MKSRSEKSSLNQTHFRLWTAYTTALRIIISLGWVQLLGKMLGKTWLEQKMPAYLRMNARRAKEGILKLKGLFIKVGQMISIMTNFLPESFRGELEELQDRVPARPYEEIAIRIERELGQPPETLFANFDQVPLASASLAQVHRATLKDGREVAVKVQYPDIEAIANLDLKAIRRIIGIVSIIFKIKGIDRGFATVREMILEELDFEQEARYLKTISANFAGEVYVGFPEVVDAYSTKHILTTSLIDGVKITDLDRIDLLGLDRETLAQRVVTAYCQMIFRDGIYHADPHPGNILVRSDGSLVFLDFGAVASLSTQMKAGIPLFFRGILKRDTEQIRRAVQQMGFIAIDSNTLNAEQIIEYFYEKFLSELSRDSWTLQDIPTDMQTKFEVMGDFRKLGFSMRDLTATFEIPKDWILLERTLLLLLGLCSHLKPEMNPMKTIRPYLEEFVFGEEGNWIELISEAAKKWALSVAGLPVSLGKFLDKANKGDLELRIGELNEHARLFYTLGHQLIYTFLCIFSGTLAYVSHTHGETLLSRGATAVSILFLLALFISMFFGRKNGSR